MIFICFKKLTLRPRISRGGPWNGWGPCFWNPGGNRSRGVGIVCNVSLDFENLEVNRNFDDRLINLRLSIHDWQLQIMCIYVPNYPKGRWEFFQACGDTRFPGCLCLLEVISIELIVLSWTKLVVTLWLEARGL